MARKLKLNPKVSYILGLYSYNKSAAIGVATKNTDVLIKFVKTVIDEFDVEPTRIISEERNGLQVAYFYNSKLKKQLDKTLERKERVFKYKNAYAAGYFAGIYDAIGGKDPRGIFLNGLSQSDWKILENLGFTIRGGKKVRFARQSEFLSFING